MSNHPIDGHINPQDLSKETRYNVPSPVRHIEYTVTLACKSVDQGDKCPGCVSLPGEKIGVIRENNKETAVDAGLINGNLQEIEKAGYNVVTLMGGEPLDLVGFDEVIAWMVNSKMTGATYSGKSQIFLQSNSQKNRSAERISRYKLGGQVYDRYEQAGLFDRFGWLKFSVDRLIDDTSQMAKIGNPMRASDLKSYYGKIVAELLAEKGTPPAIHMTMRKDNISQVLNMYEWAKERGIRFSCSPMVYNWLSAGASSQRELEEMFPLRLTQEDSTQLAEIAQHLYAEAVDQLSYGKPRLVVPSSAFFNLLATHGPENSVNCYRQTDLSNQISRSDHQQADKIKPDIQDISPSALISYCIKTGMRDDLAHRCKGCFGSAGVDRSNGFRFAESQGNGLSFLNGDGWLKDPTGIQAHLKLLD